MDIPCLNEISVKLTGRLAFALAKSDIAIIADLPLDVNFILLNRCFSLIYSTYLYIPTKLVKIRKKIICDAINVLYK